MTVDLATASTLVSTMAVLGGVAFDVAQIRDARRKQAAQAAQSFVHSIQTERWAMDHSLAHTLPIGIARPSRTIGRD